MAGRKRMKECKKGLPTAQAIELAQKVFELKDRLNIKYEQMAEESGLSKKQLQSIKQNWINCKGKTYKYMYPSIANGLIKFWNMHLINGNLNNLASGLDPLTAALVEKVGFNKAHELLKERGKEQALAPLLKKLSAEELADLI